MAANLSQIDIAALRLRITSNSLPIADRCRSVEELMEFYPSRRNTAFVRRQIKSWLNASGYKKEALKLKTKILEKDILANREKIRQKRKEVAAIPPQNIAPVVDEPVFVAQPFPRD